MADFEETIGYSEVKDRFTSRFGFIPEGFVHLGKNLYSFLNKRLFVHYGNSGNNHFYGVEHNSKIRLVCNEVPATVKIFKSIRIHGTGKPSKIVLKTSHPYPQETDIFPDEMKVIEGDIYAPILNDKFSPNVNGSEYQKMLSGDPMRSKRLEIEITYNHLTPFELRGLTIGYIRSPGHP
ncbi:MAG: hypothetical protein CMI36_01050 [Owenweeksia sp.]|nr:hypothetical protein [Owenweeksia sp.]MBF97550.1 hypothetical protein [Owenweeksia sp.]HBF18751.1 hypothetical protein [Cryomorphaceae bacterium]HCQ17350.1 hypothetical protein [Cryomorphaceae bacterium]|tara:strand:+ start:2711 stop:3247 length:537 start_codon:yes stop_codon:yes gene_type:complete